MGQRSKQLLRAKPFANLRGSSSRAAARSSAKPRFYSLFWRANCGRRPRQRDRSRGIPKGERLWTALLPTFLQEQKSRGPARPKRVKGKLRIFKKQKRDNKRLPAKKAVPAAWEVPRRGKRIEGINDNFHRQKGDKQSRTGGKPAKKHRPRRRSLQKKGKPRCMKTCSGASREFFSMVWFCRAL